jgi:hypothetical protein
VLNIAHRPVNDKGWPDPGASTTWEISNEQARAALDRAEHWRSNEAAYTYNRLGIGLNSYNCAQFAESVLQGAGIDQSAGLVFATPLEVATGQKVRFSVSKIYSTLKANVIALTPSARAAAAAERQRAIQEEERQRIERVAAHYDY